MEPLWQTWTSVSQELMGPWLDVTLKSCLAVSFVLLATYSLRRASAALRHLLLTTALSVLCALPVLSTCLPAWQILPASWFTTPPRPLDTVYSSVEAEPTSVPIAATPPPTDAVASQLSPPDLENQRPKDQIEQRPPRIPATSDVVPVTLPPLNPNATHTTWWSPWPPYLMAVWLFVSGMLVARCLASDYLLRRAARNCTWLSTARGSSHSVGFAPSASQLTSPDSLLQALAEARDQLHITRRVHLLLDPRPSIPLVWGLLQPKLRLPATALTWDHAEQRSVLLHELAHIRRHDLWVVWLTQCVCAIYWFNPLVWVLAECLHGERERACDDLVLSSGVLPSTYAEHLLNIAQSNSAAQPDPWRRLAPWSGLAMANGNSLERRLRAILSNQLNRREVAWSTIAWVGMLSGLLAIPLAMVRGQGATAPEPARGVPLNPLVSAQLDWGAEKNGLRGAILVGPTAAGGPDGIYLVIQNVSHQPIRFTDTTPAPDLRELHVTDAGRIQFVLSMDQPTQIDVQLEPQEVTYLELVGPNAGTEQQPLVAILVEGLRKEARQTWRATLALSSAPAGAWTGELQTGYTRGTTTLTGPQPTHAEAQLLYKVWQSNARLNGDIPGGLVKMLQAKVEEFVRNNLGDRGGSSAAQKMQPLIARFDGRGDWKPTDVVQLLDDIANAHEIPLETTLEQLGQETLQRGLTLPASLSQAPWGQPLPSGLRAALVLEPLAHEYPLNSEHKARLVLHNSGQLPVVFLTTSFQQPAHTARLVDGAELTIDSTEWLTLGRQVGYRLAPGEYCEVYTPGLGIGTQQADRDDWANVRAGSWILCTAGNDVELQPGPVVLNPPREPAAVEDWWLKFIQQRLEREKPIPADLKEREYLLYRVVTDLFGAAPMTDEGEAFAKDTSAAAAENLAQLLARRTTTMASNGPIEPGKIRFHVLPVDTTAAQRPRVTSTPGWYTLRDDLRFSVDRRPVGGRAVHEASIILFRSGQENFVHPVPLPAGDQTWSAAWEKDGTQLWISAEQQLRCYEFSDASQIVETTYSDAQIATAPISAELRAALEDRVR